MCDFILLLASLDIDSHNISYRDIITALMRGRHKKKAILDDIYKDNNMSKSWSKKRSSNATRYRKMSSVFGKVGILNAAFFDLSFFLKLNYDIDLYTFYSFCKLVCRGSMTLSTALWLYELTYASFFNTYFISAIYSFNNFVFVNNVNSVDHRYRLVCIGDVIEVRAKSVFSDSFIILCNIIGQCKLSIIKHV